MVRKDHAGTAAPGDTWHPTASFEMLRLRAGLYTRIRQFFADRDVLEVDTPMLSTAMNPDRNIDSVVVQGEDYPRYLHTSPEFPMKRLLAAGSGPIWQLCRVFRRGEAGRRHNPEFTMLEWYQPGYDEFDLMQEVADLLRLMRADLPQQTLTYREAFVRHAGFDPLALSLPQLAEQTRQRFQWRDDERDPMLDLWLAAVVEPALPPDTLTFIHQWPASMAALAECAPDADGHLVSRRFEAFWQGMELANGYFELRDPAEQARRFEADQRYRALTHKTIAPVDAHLQAAMVAGLPACAGVALGVDRWLMALTGSERIDEVLAFPYDRA